MLTTSAIIMNQQVVLRLKCESVLHGLLYHWNIETSREIQFSFELKCISIAPGFRVRERAGRGRGTMSPSPRRPIPFFRTLQAAAAPLLGHQAAAEAPRYVSQAAVKVHRLRPGVCPESAGDKLVPAY
jgi:hypothetical protein